MVCFGYIIVNTLHKSDNKDDDDDNNNNSLMLMRWLNSHKGYYKK